MVGRVQYFNIGGEAPKMRHLLPMADLKGMGDVTLDVESDGLAVAWITLSDKGSRGEREDTSGPTVEEMCEERLNMRYCLGHIIPDDISQLKALLTDLALMQCFDLIVTTGGTGVAPRDITPEATLTVLEKRLPGIEHAMTAASLAKKTARHDFQGRGRHSGRSHHRQPARLPQGGTRMPGRHSPGPAPCLGQAAGRPGRLRNPS